MTTRFRLALDAFLLVGVLAAFNPARTGIALHEWLSLAIAVTSLLHLIINWDWVLHTASRIGRRIKAASAVNLVVDSALFLATVTVMLSGFMVSQTISTAMGVNLVPTVAWHVVHGVSAQAAIGLMILHLALHAGWISRALSSRKEISCAS